MLLESFLGKGGLHPGEVLLCCLDKFDHLILYSFALRDYGLLGRDNLLDNGRLLGSRLGLGGGGHFLGSFGLGGLVELGYSLLHSRAGAGALGAGARLALGCAWGLLGSFGGLCSSGLGLSSSGFSGGGCLFLGNSSLGSGGFDSLLCVSSLFLGYLICLLCDSSSGFGGVTRFLLVFLLVLGGFIVGLGDGLGNLGSCLSTFFSISVGFVGISFGLLLGIAGILLGFLLCLGSLLCNLLPSLSLSLCLLFGGLLISLLRDRADRLVQIGNAFVDSNECFLRGSLCL